MGYYVPTFVALSLVYAVWSFYPKPLAGIPFNAKSKQQIFGDIPAVKKKAKRTKETSDAMIDIARQLRVSMAQLLVTSFTGPYVVVDDPREVEDILFHRDKEFDRSPLTTQFFKPLFPHATISQETTPALKEQKRLWADAMSPKFLRRVVAPNVRMSAMRLVEFWQFRAKQTKGQHFEVQKDFEIANLDVIWGAILGTELGGMNRKLEAGLNGQMNGHAHSVDDIKFPTSSGASPQNRDPGYVMQQILAYMNFMTEEAFQSSWPAWTFWKHQRSSKFQQCKKIRDEELHRLMKAACEKFQRNLDGAEGDGEGLDTCAMDMVLRKKVLAAKKTGKPMPDPTKDVTLLDELLLLLLAVRLHLIQVPRSRHEG